MAKKIVYRAPADATLFDHDRFIKSLKGYGEVDEEKVDALLAEHAQYDPMHVSCLVRIGVFCLPEEAAEKYYNDHKEWLDAPDFERLRRITGYLVGTLSRWNDGKIAEEHDRVKHSVGQYTQEEKAEIEAKKLENSVEAQA